MASCPPHRQEWLGGEAEAVAQVNGTILGQEGGTCAWLKGSWTEIWGEAGRCWGKAFCQCFTVVKEKWRFLAT